MDALQEYLTNTWAFVLLVLGFGFVIFVHELGHFLVAKWVGIKVTQFALGFGPSVLSWRKGLGFRVGSSEAEMNARVNEHLSQNKNAADPTAPTAEVIDRAARELGLGETEYRLNGVPLGGYVKMLGQEDIDPSALSDDPRSFNRKPIWARACVISAGVVMNLIFGVIFFIIAFMHGVRFNPAIVGEVSDRGPAAIAYAQGHEGDPAYQGLQPGDRILSVDGEPVADFGELRVKIALARQGDPLTLLVERQDEEGHTRQLTYLVTPRIHPVLKLLSIDIEVSNSLEVSGKPENFPPELSIAEVKPGMRISNVNGREVQNFAQYSRLVEAAKGQPVTVTITAANGTTVQAKLKAQPELMLDEVKDEGSGAEPVYSPPHLLGLVPVTQVQSTLPGSPAELAGLKSGDLIARVETALWPDVQKVMETIKNAGEKSVALDVWRSGKLVSLGPVQRNREGQLGVLLRLATDSPLVSQTLPRSPTAALNLNHGSRIIAINGTPVDSYGDMLRVLSAAASAARGPDQTQPSALSVKVAYQLNIAGQPESEKDIPIDAPAAQALLNAHWLQPLPQALFDPALVPIKASNPFDAARIGVEKTGQFMIQTWLTVGRLFQGSVPLKQMSGPVGIAHQGTRVAKHEGWPMLLWFLGLISANLAVINFLPLPIVDGGHIVLMIIEKLKGSPVNAKVQVAITYVGLALFLGLFLYITFNDVVRLFPRL